MFYLGVNMAIAEKVASDILRSRLQIPQILGVDKAIAESLAADSQIFITQIMPAFRQA